MLAEMHYEAFSKFIYLQIQRLFISKLGVFFGWFFFNLDCLPKQR